MRSATFFGVFGAVMVCLATSASAGERDSVGATLGKLRWGMGQSDVVATVIAKIENSYADDIQRTRMTPAETDVRNRMRAEIADLRGGHVTFDGSRNRWDGTYLAGEFTHGNGESLVTYADATSRNFYFFINGKFWKWIKAFDQPTFSGKDFDDFSGFVRGRFGRGSEKRGARTPQGNSVRFVEMSEGNTRMRAYDRIGGDRSFALVFEDKGTIGKLASLRSNRSRSGNSDDRAVASNDHTEANDGESSRFGDRRSIGDDQAPHQETEAEYRERSQREIREAREHQAEQHTRGQAVQRGRTLDGLAGMNDSDPLSGF
jgi:hypothetical protein